MNTEQITLGTILVSCWGYEQTNVEFFEVVQLAGKTTLVLRELAQTRTDHGSLSMSGTALPKAGDYTGEPIRRRINKAGGVKVHECSNAYPWSGKPINWSSYA